MAAIGNFIGAFVFPVAVATTVGKGIIDPQSVSVIVIVSALVGAIIWNVITWFFGLPTSSSHALIGGLLGAASLFNSRLEYHAFFPAVSIYFLSIVAYNPLIAIIEL